MMRFVDTAHAAQLDFREARFIGDGTESGGKARVCIGEGTCVARATAAHRSPTCRRRPHHRRPTSAAGGTPPGRRRRRSSGARRWTGGARSRPTCAAARSGPRPRRSRARWRRSPADHSEEGRRAPRASMAQDSREFCVARRAFGFGACRRRRRRWGRRRRVVGEDARRVRRREDVAGRAGVAPGEEASRAVKRVRALLRRRCAVGAAVRVGPRASATATRTRRLEGARPCKVPPLHRSDGGLPRPRLRRRVRRHPAHRPRA